MAAIGNAATDNTTAATNVSRAEKAMISRMVSCAAESTMKLHSSKPTSHAGWSKVASVTQRTQSID